MNKKKFKSHLFVARPREIHGGREKNSEWQCVKLFCTSPKDCRTGKNLGCQISLRSPATSEISTFSPTMSTPKHRNAVPQSPQSPLFPPSSLRRSILGLAAFRGLNQSIHQSITSQIAKSFSRHGSTVRCSRNEKIIPLLCIAIAGSKFFTTLF